MIIWGGDGSSSFNTGGRYNPVTDTWTATSTSNAPTARRSHTAVWTGTEMVVWGGYAYVNTGGRYNPATDSWIATSTTNAPTARDTHSAVWTGTEMIIWGGNSGSYLNTGGRYNLATDSWTATTTVNAPSQRSTHSGIWTGTEMIVWGGYGGSHLNTGGRYNPVTNSWIATSTTGAPVARRYHAAVLTATEMVVWGGYNGSILNSGGRYNLSLDSWNSTSTGANVPSARQDHTAAWTGTEMIVWGGSGSSPTYKNDGGKYNPATDSWTATTMTNAPTARYIHTAVWAGTKMIVWGGYNGGYLNTGGVYSPGGGTLVEGDHTFEVRAYDLAMNVDPTPASYDWTIDLTAPNTSLDSFPDNPSNSSDASFYFSSNETNCSFECKMDSGTWAACTSPKNYSGLSSSSHTFMVRAVDAAGNIDPTPASYTWAVDTIAPNTSINTYPSNPTNLSTAIFSFSCNESSCIYECNLDSLGWEPCASPVTYSFLLSGPHTFEVRATDLAGNTDQTPASFTWTIDQTPPDTAITANPPDPDSHNFTDFAFICTEPPCTFECNLDSTGWATCSTPQHYVGLTNNSHNFAVRAYDLAMNIDPSPATYTWTVNANPPDTFITSQPPDPSNSTSPTFEFNCSPGPCTFECNLDSQGFVACSSPKNYSGLANGSHSFQVRGIDSENNADLTPASYTWTIDTTAPNTAINSNPPNPSTSSSAQFSFSCTGGPCTFECRMDGPSWSVCSSPASYTGLSDGTHTFGVRAKDAAGNYDPTPASYTWTIDTSIPDTFITSYPPDPTNSTAASFQFSCSDASCTYECKLDSSGWASCTSPKNYAGVESWVATSTTNAPSARYYHRAVWTGSEMIIWGGYNSSYLNTGGRYNPSTDSWTATSTTSAPTGRNAFAAVWTGNEMILWGGGNASTSFNTGGRYNPATDSWTATTTTNAPSARYAFPAVWTGTEMIIFGGYSTGAFSSGGRYNPSNNSWTATTTTNAPSARSSHAMVWTGTKMIVWGGWSTGDVPLNTGASYDPVGDSWTATSTGANVPAARWDLSSVWTGTEMIVWGGYVTSRMNTGGRYNPSTNSWVATAITDAPSARNWAFCSQGAVWTGTDMIIWGGDNSPLSNGGGKYNPLTNTWTTTTTTNAPVGRFGTDIIWTGTKMIAWGGYNGGYLNTGGQYTPGYGSLNEGDHTFEVRAYDLAMNVDPTPASYDWTIDLTAPNTSLDSFPANPSNSPDATFVFNCNETACTFECKMDSGTWAACTSPRNYSSLTEGSHTFQVRATDTVNNLDPTPASYTWTVDSIAPDTSINTHPSDPTNSSDAIFSFSCNESSCIYMCNLDSMGWEPCDSPISYSLLLATVHTFEVRATDLAGNTDQTPAGFTWTIDQTPPDTAITANPPDPDTHNYADFFFTCNETPCTFQCNLDSAGWGSCTSPKNYVALANGLHAFEVRAYDLALNLDPSPAAYSWNINSNPPDTFITAQPTNPSNSSSASFEFNCSPGPCTFECKLDSQAFSSCSSPKNYSGLTDGSHNFQVRAIDAENNIDTTPATYAWTIDTTPPDTQITAQPANPTKLTSASFSFSCTGGPCTFECNFDSLGWEACVSPKDYTGLSEAAHNFQVRAIDSLNNVDPTPASYNWTVDTTPPDTAITANPVNPSTSLSAGFSFTCTQTPCTYECNLDSAGFSVCTSPAVYTGLVPGDHIFEVRATDAAGNTDTTPASYSWLIQAPQNRWENVSTTGVPDARSYHAAIWTGTEMIVWGGFGAALLNSGGRYNPSTDSWTPTSTANAPEARYYHSAVWSGSEMIVWGGAGNVSYLGNGGRYNPSSDSWTATSTTGAPTAREFHTAIWTGAEMVVWGGNGGSNLNTGSRYNPGTDSWNATTTANAPSARNSHNALWTGTEMFIWGGGSNTGGRYNPVSDSWTATSTTNAPSARSNNSAVWNGIEMIVWGGNSGSTYYNTGGKYNPSSNLWTATSTGANVPSARNYHVAVWAGSVMVVWGGSRGSTYYATGGVYDPFADTWSPTSDTGAPSARQYPTAVWTGTQMIIWGGFSGSAHLNTGGRYVP